jgi:hypothetical protein
MLTLPVLRGYNTIQIYKMVGGSSRWPHTIVWKVCGNTLVDEVLFSVLDQNRWTLLKSGKRLYVVRREDTKNIGRKKGCVMMSREILGLPTRQRHVVEDEADHRNHDTLDNTKENLRVATREQNMMNLSKYGIKCRFKGVTTNTVGFKSGVRYNQKLLRLGTYKTDVEAALAYFYAGTLVYGEFFHGTHIPEGEMPPEARQEEIWQLVLGKLRAAGLLAEA